MAMMRIFGPIMAVLIGSVATAWTAPPTITSIEPAGLQRGTSTEITLTGTFDPWPARIWISGSDVTAEALPAKGKVKITASANAETGIRWLRISNAEGASSLRPVMIGLVPELTEKEPNNEPKAPQRIESLPVVINGKLAKSGDVDGYAVALKKGQTLIAHLQAHEGLRSPMDAILQILSSDGFVVEQNNDYNGLDPFLHFTAPADGVYSVRVFAFPAMPDSSIRFAGGDGYIYRLMLTTDGFADYAWPLAIARSSPRKIDLVGWNIPATGRQISITPGPDEYQTIIAKGVSNSTRIRIEPHPVLERIPTEPAVAPFTLSGRLETMGKSAVIPIQTKKAQPLRVMIESHTLGFPLMPILAIVDANGKSIQRVEPKTIDEDCELTFNPPSDGVYRIEVSDLYKSASTRHVYRLRVLTVQPKVDLTATVDRWLVPMGKPLEVPITVQPGAGFTGSVELSAEGLPDGIAMTTLKSDPKSITVQFEAKKSQLAGPFEIIARRKGDDRFRQRVVVKLAEFDEQLPFLWINSGK